MSPLLTVSDLRVHAGEKLLASLGELVVHAGECVAIVGESGSGKTTTLRAMLGLADGLTVTGSIETAGVDVVSAGERELAKVRGSAIAMISQSPQDSLNPTMRLGRLMRLVLGRHGVRGSEARERAREAMKAVLLDEELLRRYPHQISGGQAQRFAIALAVALRSPLLLADEPTSALDVTVQAAVVAVLARLREEYGIGLVFVSHDLALVSQIADRVVVMRDGRVVEAGPAAQVLADPVAAYTRELIDAVPAIGG